MENAQPEPSMEEILASIRRIISEDEEEATPTVPKPAPTHETANQTEERIEPVAPISEPAPHSAPLTPPLEMEDVDMIKQNVTEAIDQNTDEAILNEATVAAASEAFQNLSESMRISSGEGRTLEDLVVQMLKPMIKDWLNQNLPAIVEEKVEEEVQRVARRRG